MSVEITPALLSDLRQKAEAVEPNDYILTDGLAIKSESFKDLTIADCAFSDDAEFIAAASPAVVLALVKELAKYKAESIERDIARADGVLRMFRGEQQDFTGLFSEGDLIAEGLDKPADVDGTTAGIWASFIERKQLEAEQYNCLVMKPIS